ncbi:MAG: DUF1722 domain-containing protein [PVC group bacterium]|nr:DUF1722 domain-containing protein [PVC group bacterium]
MGNYVKPRVILSRCLTGDTCRWDAEIIKDDIIDKLKPLVSFIPVCPELEIGLEVPRERVRIISKDNELRLLQLNTNKDLTLVMKKFSEAFLESMRGIDGVILKAGSPSCGIGDSKVYADMTSDTIKDETSGFFAAEVLKRFPHLAVETDIRLKDTAVREDFWIRLFALARFRVVKTMCSLPDLVKFHEENKFLFKGYDREEYELMEQTIRDNKETRPDSIIRVYAEHFYRCLIRKS